MKKACTKCREIKSLDAFYKNEKARDKHASQCKTCTDATVKKYRQKNRRRVAVLALKRYHANPKYQKLSRVKFLYGLDEVAYNNLAHDSGGRCAICKAEAKLGIDHDHTTGKVRGMLCRKCNSGIGQLCDSITILKAAIEYLSK